MKTLKYLPFLIAVSLTLLTAGAFAHETISKDKEVPWCDSHREFVTTLEYMRKQDFYEMGEQHSRQIAKQVAKGCTGAAGRYVRVYELLKKVEAGARTTISPAVELSQKSDSHVTTFMDVFRNAYGEKALDLDMNNSLKIARSLSVDYSGKPEKAKQDYDKLVKFCLDDKKVGGSIPLCAELALEVAKSGENFKAPVADAFIETYEYLRNTKDLNLQISGALDIDKNVVSIHPEASNNYVASLKYSLSKSGLSMPVKSSLSFAFEMAQGTRPSQELNKIDAERLPAYQKE